MIPPCVGSAPFPVLHPDGGGGSSGKREKSREKMEGERSAKTRRRNISPPLLPSCSTSLSHFCPREKKKTKGENGQAQQGRKVICWLYGTLPLVECGLQTIEKEKEAGGVKEERGDLSCGARKKIACSSRRGNGGGTKPAPGSSSVAPLYRTRCRGTVSLWIKEEGIIGPVTRFKVSLQEKEGERRSHLSWRRSPIGVEFQFWPLKERGSQRTVWVRFPVSSPSSLDSQRVPPKHL